MEYQVRHPESWQAFERAVAFRYLPRNATYSADSPYASRSGRFDNGTRPSLYLSLSREGAVAEYYRRHPELLQFQPTMKVRLYEVAVDSVAEGLDVRTPVQASLIGFPFPRLTSSDANEIKRYAECRQLTRDVEEADGVSIAYPSAAYVGGHNVVLFEDPSSEGWYPISCSETSVPLVEPVEVIALSL